VARREWMEPTSEVSLRRQCALLGISRNAWYYQPRPESKETVGLMNQIDEIYTQHPYYGYRKIQAELGRRGMQINHKRVSRLMRQMGLAGMVPQRNLSCPGLDPWVMPYLLSGLNIDRPHRVWATDITYIRLESGFCFLTAIMDWYSRYVLAWRLSNTLDGGILSGMSGTSLGGGWLRSRHPQQRPGEPVHLPALD